MQRCIHWLCQYSNGNAADKENADSTEFRKFRRQLFHSSLSYILQSLRPGMTTPEVMRFPDGHFRRTIFGLGPYIADYPEQALLACIVNNWCPKYVYFQLHFIDQTDVLIGVHHLQMTLTLVLFLVHANFLMPKRRTWNLARHGMHMVLLLILWCSLFLMTLPCNSLTHDSSKYLAIHK